jgi:hypothetical protein
MKNDEGSHRTTTKQGCPTKRVPYWQPPALMQPKMKHNAENLALFFFVIKLLVSTIDPLVVPVHQLFFQA